jgi:DNA polymerase-3 subunit epsilon
MKKILIVDIETTGFLKRGGKIVEVGIVELNLEDGSKKILFDEVCWEEGITKEECDASWIVENSTLTTEDIRKSKRLGKHRCMIQKIINRYPLGATAFNNKFDFDFLEDRGFIFRKKLDCPMLLSTNICKIPSPRGRGYKWPKVQEAYDFFFPDNEYIEKHRGADDAFYEADIVFKLYKLSIFKLN